VDIREEVKYDIPSGGVFTGAWCRPQNDGPGLRALTLMEYANLLIKAGKADELKSQGLWTGDNDNLGGGTIAWNLDFIAANPNTSTCDLWEEIRSDDIFWNKYTMRRALVLGGDFATARGDLDRAAG